MLNRSRGQSRRFRQWPTSPYLCRSDRQGRPLASQKIICAIVFGRIDASADCRALVEHSHPARFARLQAGRQIKQNQETEGTVNPVQYGAASGSAGTLHGTSDQHKTSDSKYRPSVNP